MMVSQRQAVGNIMPDGLFVMLVTGCHRSPFGADQTPVGEGAVLVLDYTLNCLYPNEVPEDGCPSIAPNEYTVNNISAAKEAAHETYLRLLLNEVLDIDANSPSLDDEASPEVLDASVEERVDNIRRRGLTAHEPTSDDRGQLRHNKPNDTNNIDTHSRFINDWLCCITHWRLPTR